MPDGSASSASPSSAIDGGDAASSAALGADAGASNTSGSPLDAAVPAKGDGGGDGATAVGNPVSADAGVSDAGDAGASMGDAGPSGAEAGMDSEDPCGADAQLVTGMARKQGSGGTNLQTSGTVEILSFHAVMKVPSKPTPTRGTLFLWPGLQPLKSDSTIGYGVLQPVLTWGSSCAPGSLSTYDTWWISGQYVGTPPGSFAVKCDGGDVMKVEVGDELDIKMTLEGTFWNQVITNKSNGKLVSFRRDMKGQKQQWLINSIELTGSTKPVDDVIFTSMVVKLSESQPKACAPNVSGTSDYFSPPRASSDGKTCCLSKVILRASGVKASSPDTP